MVDDWNVLALFEEGVSTAEREEGDCNGRLNELLDGEIGLNTLVAPKPTPLLEGFWAQLLLLVLLLKILFLLKLGLDAWGEEGCNGANEDFLVGSSLSDPKDEVGGTTVEAIVDEFVERPVLLDPITGLLTLLVTTGAVLEISEAFLLRP